MRPRFDFCLKTELHSGLIPIDHLALFSVMLENLKTKSQSLILPYDLVIQMPDLRRASVEQVML
jgi:hypothetical protein